MISTMELMEKKTPSIKKTDRKKGMTLVEVMAAMAILSILFMGISSFIIGIVRNEAKSERKLESDGYLKNALLMFESGVVSLDKVKEYFEVNPNKNFNFSVSFNDVLEMQEKIEKLAKDEDGTYTLTISISESGDLYRVNATFTNERREEYSKHVYILKN